MSDSYLEKAVLAIFKELNIEMPEVEHRFCIDRKWRFDFAWPRRMVAIEIEGGHGGRHQRYYGYKADCDKYNRATLMGWRVYRFTRQHIAEAKFNDILLTIFKLSKGV